MTEVQLLLARAAAELTALRQDNRIMSGRLQMFDKMISLFEAQPPNCNYGLASPDIIGDINDWIKNDRLNNPEK